MTQILGFVLLVVIVTYAGAQEKAFEDIWTKELRDSNQTCRGRLPNPLDGQDLNFLKSLVNTELYFKYADQPFVLRLLDGILSKPESQNKPLSEIRCLFESPCMTAKGFSQPNATLEMCTGGSVRFETRPLGNDGTFEGAIQGGNGTKALTITGVPTFTDRKSFVTFIFCGSDGSLGFLVVTNRPGLAAYTRHLIKDHLNNSGFNDNFRVTTTYMSSSCKDKL